MGFGRDRGVTLGTQNALRLSDTIFKIFRVPLLSGDASFILDSEHSKVTDIVVTSISAHSTAVPTCGTIQEGTYTATVCCNRCIALQGFPAFAILWIQGNVT